MSTKKLISHVYTILFVLVFVLSLAFSVLDVTPVHADGIIYANPDGTGDCSSWANACTLQTALTGALSGDEIWAAAGTYKPTTGTDRAATFQLKDGVSLYGGFAGIETAREQRDWENNLTILSGDIDGNDITDGTGVIIDTDNIQGTNSYHVVTSSGVTETTRLDGFIITAGWVNDGSSGGGMYNVYGSPMLTNLIFSGNLANNSGGGITNDNSSPTLTNVTFSANSAISFGGGMYNYADSSPTLTNVTFNDNSAWDSGGGMSNYYSSPTLTNVTFSGNTAIHGGGGIANLYDSNSMLTNVSFNGNTAGDDGGGMVNGGQNAGSNPILTNVTFSGNSATHGGGMANYDNSSPMLTNVTFSGNLAATSGGGIYNHAGSIPVVQNSILWGNTPEQVFNDGGIPTIRYSLVGGCNPSGTWNDACGTDGGNNLTDSDPQFVAPEPASSAPTTAGDYRLQDASPAINAGDNAADLDGTGVGTATISDIIVDLDGNPHFVRVRVDLGAYENQTFSCPAGGVLYVDQDAVGQQTGASWSDALTTLQDALQVSEACEIWVAEGVYLPDEGGSKADNDRTATFQLKDSVALYGGFAGTETAREQRDWATNPTILSGDIDGNDITDPTGVVTTTTGINGPNSYHVVTSNNASSTAIMDGFFVTAGLDAGVTGMGGGMSNSGGSPTLANVTFSGNLTYSNGGGMGNDHSSPTLTNVTFSGNAAYNGGGMFNLDSSPTLTNVTFSGNTVAYLGGGMVNTFSNPTLTSVTFSSNSAGYGGGMGNDGSPTLTNVTFSGNSAQYGGGGVYNWSGNPTLTNVTFSGNTAVNYVGGMYNDNSSSPMISDTIFWGNTAPTEAQIYNDSSTSGSSSVNDSVVLSGCPVGSTCINIITTDPMLGTFGDYGGFTQTIPLLAHSSSINKGNNATCAATDQRGVARPQGARCDIGAFELVDNTPPNTSIDSENPATTPTNRTSMAFTFSGTDTVSGVRSFECDLDGGGFAACASSKSYASLADGSHTFQVCAIDFVGNVDVSPASRTWTVDTSAPTVNIFTIITPSNSLNIPITSFSATDDVALTGYLITTSSTLPASGAAGWTGTAPVTYTVASDGSYTLYPWAKDAAGNVSAIFAAPPSVVVDSTAPETTIINKPANPDNDSSPTFTFSGDDGIGSGVASFMCRMDGGSYTTCTSPFTSPTLASGSHTFYVYAIDMLGNEDASPASYTWMKPFIIFLPLILH